MRKQKKKKEFKKYELGYLHIDVKVLTKINKDFTSEQKDILYDHSTALDIFRGFN